MEALICFIRYAGAREQSRMQSQDDEERRERQREREANEKPGRRNKDSEAQQKED